MSPPPAGPPRVLFISYHCYHDPSSGAAVCTRDLFAALVARGRPCGALTGPQLDDAAAAPAAAALRADSATAVSRGRAGAADFDLYSCTGPGGFPVTLYAPDPPAAWRDPTPDEAAGFVHVCGHVLRRFRPAAVLTYGGDIASRGAAALARAAGVPVAFWLHNFAYADRAPFADCAAVVVPSRCSAEHYRAALGLECVVLPPVIDPARVVAPPPPEGRRFLTFVNPLPDKGLFPFARIAEVLGRERPDIPILVVEGRGRVDRFAGCGVDPAALAGVWHLPNTPDPREFYRVSRVVLMPSVFRESYGRVAVEAMFNGIPVIASDRGALPEVVGDGGLCLPLPPHITPETRIPPSESEVAAWVGAVVRLWDDPAAYAAASAAAERRAAELRPEATVPLWEAFLDGFAGCGL